MRLNLAFLTTIALVSFAYAVPVPREAPSLQVRSDPLKVTSVSVIYNPAGLVVDQGNSGAAESLMKVAINSALVPKFTPVDDDDFHFEITSATKNKDTAKFTLDVQEENEKTKKYKGGELDIGTNTCDAAAFGPGCLVIYQRFPQRLQSRRISLHAIECVGDANKRWSYSNSTMELGYFMGSRRKSRFNDFNCAGVGADSGGASRQKTHPLE
ncbi:hypothetical protein F5876DRAFT_68861 [Lentinula aff. lateritia]|uniref:Uncharacterized protein n=1 Tax=Lentinula aff. lateritia TaxID=2804960 RepID=A0ACC1TPR0_9AGAR|nr:hypothetical protein F5876DRAFT_68861 [Lentinula aff. lateritia]